MLKKPHVFWIFGLSGAGKTSLAMKLVEALQNRQIPVLAIDGDILRKGLCHDLGFETTDRTENIRRASEVALLGIRSGVCVVASFITPLMAHRDMIRKIVGSDDVSLIFADAPLVTCRQRDVKGFYALAERGQIKNMTGVDAIFEIPVDPDLTLSTSTLSLDANVEKLFHFVKTKLNFAR